MPGLAIGSKNPRGSLAAETRARARVDQGRDALRIA
jgi:hypothetical protein